MYHKQATSARLLFFVLNESICHFDSLPSKSEIVDSNLDEEQVVEYPEDLIPKIKERLAISSDILEIDPIFQAIAKANDTTLIPIADFKTNSDRFLIFPEKSAS